MSNATSKSRKGRGVPKPEGKPDVAERGVAGFDTWEEYIADRMRRFEGQPKQRRLAETERIVSAWHRGGFRLFCELLDRAARGAICTPERARAVLPTILEVVDEEESYAAEAQRAQRLLELGKQGREEKRRRSPPRKGGLKP